MKNNENSSLSTLLDLKDQVLHEGNIGLLCNQTSYSYKHGLYLFDILAERGNLVRLFLPEHGLFAELQDQIPLVSTELYEFMKLDVEIISLYGDQESSLVVNPSYLADLDALIVDIQDIGSRYYTFATTVSYIFDVLAANDISLTVYIPDRHNPCGRQIEGTRLESKYASFVGRPGLPHKHGLSIGELCQFYKHRIGGKFDIKVIPYEDQSTAYTWEIAPSPNMPTSITPLVYTGQCLLEGTNLSEGRGTTRPFEIWGAPFMKWIHNDEAFPTATGAILRPTRFIPMFHKHARTVCDGFQIHLNGAPYHSLEHSLRMIRHISENSDNAFKWRDEAYEFRHDLPAIKLLAGDDILIDYLYGKTSFRIVKERLADEEDAWINEAKKFTIYGNRFSRVSI